MFFFPLYSIYPPIYIFHPLSYIVFHIIRFSIFLFSIHIFYPSLSVFRPISYFFLLCIWTQRSARSWTTILWLYGCWMLLANHEKHLGSHLALTTVNLSTYSTPKLWTSGMQACLCPCWRLFVQWHCNGMCSHRTIIKYK